MLSKNSYKFSEEIKKLEESIKTLSHSIDAYAKKHQELVKIFNAEVANQNAILHDFSCLNIYTDYSSDVCYYQIEQTSCGFVVEPNFPSAKIEFIKMIFESGPRGLVLDHCSEASLDDFDQMLLEVSDKTKTELLFNLDLIKRWIG